MRLRPKCLHHQKSFNENKNHREKKQQNLQHTLQEWLKSRMENTWSLNLGLATVYIASVHYLSNSLLTLLSASLLLIFAMWSNCASNCCLTWIGKRQRVSVKGHCFVLFFAQGINHSCLPDFLSTVVLCHTYIWTWVIAYGVTRVSHSGWILISLNNLYSSGGDH